MSAGLRDRGGPSIDSGDSRTSARSLLSQLNWQVFLETTQKSNFSANYPDENHLSFSLSPRGPDFAVSCGNKSEIRVAAVTSLSLN